MSDYNEKPKTSMEMLIEAYNNPQAAQKPVKEKKEVVKEAATDSRTADVRGMIMSIMNAHKEIRTAGQEINQLPTDVSQRLFQRYQDADMALTRLEKELQALL